MRKILHASFQAFFLLLFLLLTQSLSAHAGDSIIFRDDFDRATLGSFWQAASSWSIVNGSAYSFTDGTGGTLRTSQDYSDASYVVETKARGFTGSYKREFRITFGQADLSNERTYVLTYKPYYRGTLTLSRSTDNVYFPEPLDEVVLYPDLNSSQWYKFKIARYKSGLIQVYLDKGAGYETIPLLEAIDSTYDKAGHIGWQADTETSAESFYVDWITAYTPSAEKPAVREKPVEDDLITQVSAKSEKLYNVAKIDTGLKVYTDRDYTITSVPAYLKGASFVQTAMDDKRNTSDTFLTFFVKRDAIIYIGYDPRGKAIPAWLNKWTKTGDYIGTTDPGSNYLEVYSKLTKAGELYPSPLLLGGNLASPAFGSEMNYLVAAIERPDLLPLQAEDAFLTGAEAANNHPGYHGDGFADYKNLINDYVEWTVEIDIPGVYNLGFTYANGDAPDRPLQITDDGMSFGILPFSSTSSWSAWSFLSGPDVFLSRGVHKIRATAIGASGPNIDELSLYYTSSSAPVILAKSIQTTGLESYLPGLSHRAYPNPFNESTKIYYTLKEKSKVSLAVYSSQGQQVQLLVNNIQEAGDYQATFNAGKFSTGIYFYRLQAGDKVKVGKLIKN